MRYWKRYVSFQIGDMIYKSPFELKFEVSFSIKGNTTTRAFIYNPSVETFKNAAPEGSGKKNTKKTITIDAGYETDHGICLVGEINSATVKRSGINKILEMKIGDSTDKWTEKEINRTWPENVKASTIINDMVNEFGLNIGKVEVKNDKEYKRSITYTKKLRTAIESMAKETSSHFFLRNGWIYFVPESDNGRSTGVLLNAATGLLEESDESGSGKIIKSLFNYRIGPGETIEVGTREKSEKYKVVKGKHYFSTESAYTEMTVERVKEG